MNDPLTKAELARAMSSEPATVRRLFSSSHVNPTVGTLAEVAAALGMRVILEPLGASDRQQITRPLHGLPVTASGEPLRQCCSHFERTARMVEAVPTTEHLQAVSYAIDRVYWCG